MGNYKIKGSSYIDWTNPESVVLLLTKDDNWLADYFNKPYNYIRRTRERIFQKIKNGKLKMEKEPGQPLYSEEQLSHIERFLEERGIPLDSIQRIHSARVGSYQTVTKDAEGNPKTHDLEVTTVSYQPRVVNGMPTYQAVPANIRPSTAKAPKLDYKLIGVFGDAQIDYRYIDGEYIPIHDERAMRVARLLLKANRPDVIVNLGDSVDLPQFSRFDKDSTHFNNHTLQRSFQRVHDYYAELRADNPQAEIHEVDSNHNTRLGKFVLKNMPDLWQFRPAGTPKEAWPMLTYPYMANLDALDIKWHSGYDAAQYEYANDMIFKHGKEIRSNGSTADLQSKKNPYANIVVGHGHKYQAHTRTTPDGQYLFAIQAPALCKITGEVSGYGSAVDDMGYPVFRYQDWQQGIVFIKDYGNGVYEHEVVFIRDGKAHHNGKLYEAGDV